MTTLDAQRCYEVWRMIIADDDLYRAVLNGEHAALATTRGLDATDLAVLDDFAKRAEGLRWNVVNLRFRATLEVALKLRAWMPLTTALLTDGNFAWLQDLGAEYLERYRWDDLGHAALAECRRFVAHVRDRIIDRRRLPTYFDVALHYETAMCELLERSAHVPPDAWPSVPAALSDSVVGAGRPRPGPVVARFELAADISEWMESGDPQQGTVHERPLPLLAFVPSLTEMYWVQPMNPARTRLFDACDGTRTTDELAQALRFPVADVRALIGAWVEQKALVLD
jgi:hypothetical protein